jgi:hypothetical protein
MNNVEHRDREICRMLGTNPSELEKLLDKSRQTISKHIDEDRFFGVDEVLEVAMQKIQDEGQRSKIVSAILSQYFPEIMKYSRDFEVTRFSTYCIFGMYIHPEIVANSVFREFITNILSDEQKFILFVCRPQKESVQLNRWLEEFKQRRSGKTASYVALPCKLVELAPIQILAEPWAGEPKLIQFSRHEIFVDGSNAARAHQLANALKEYGLDGQACGAIDDKDQRRRLAEALNSSAFEEVNTSVSDSIKYYRNRHAQGSN